MKLPYLHAAFATLTLGVAMTAGAAGQAFDDKFRQLDELLPTPGVTRNAAGAPGHAYWQQRADYKLRVTLDEEAYAGAGLHQAALMYLGLVLFFITFVVLTLSKVLLQRMKKSEGTKS